MCASYRIKSLFGQKLGQDFPGWTYVIGLIIGLFVLAFLIWLAVKSGKASVEPIVGGLG